METGMDTGVVVNRAIGRAPLPALAKWAAASLGALALVLGYMQIFLIQGSDPPLALAFGVPALLFAAPILLARRRWTPLLSALYWTLFTAVNSPYIAHDLTHPDSGGGFSIAVLMLGLAVVGIVAGLGATMQAGNPAAAGAPPAARPTPRWFSIGLLALTGLVVGALLVAAIPRASASAGVSEDVLAGLPKIVAAGHTFQPAELRVKVGETVALAVESQDVAPHAFDIDELNIHVALRPGQPSLVLFRPAKPGTYTFHCSVPGHTEAGMVGTLVVEP